MITLQLNKLLNSKKINKNNIQNHEKDNKCNRSSNGMRQCICR